MAAGFSDNMAMLGDTMNFPESSSVKKKEALSNIIFKITQTADKVNKRNERLLKLNLEYELKMLRLAIQKEKMTWDKLNYDKLCSSRTNDWLFEEEDRQSGTKNFSCNDGQYFPRLLLKKSSISNERKGQFNYQLRRANTAPTDKLNENEVKNLRESKTVADVHLVDEDIVIAWTTAIREKNQNTNEKIGGIKEIDFPKINRHGRASWGEVIKRNQGEKYERLVKTKQEEYEEKAAKKPSNQNKTNTQTDSIRLKDIREEKGEYPDEEVDLKIDSIATFLKRAEESTKISSAYIPSGTAYRRLCVARKSHEDTERKKPRILTRYLRERRASECVSKMDKKYICQINQTMKRVASL